LKARILCHSARFASNEAFTVASVEIEILMRRLRINTVSM